MGGFIICQKALHSMIEKANIEYNEGGEKNDGEYQTRPAGLEYLSGQMQ